MPATRTYRAHPFAGYMVRALLLVVLVISMNARSVFAQDDQEYKRAYNAALAAYQAKNFDEAHTQWTTAAHLARQAGDTDIERKSRYYVAQLDYRRGVTAFKAKDYEQALKHHQAGTAIYPDYTKNLYGEGLALKKLGHIDEALAKWKAVIDAGKDRKTTSTAQKAIRDHFYFQASSAVSKQHPTRADADRCLAALKASEAYLEPDADYYYYTAVAHNVRGEYTQSIAVADKALDIHRGSRTDKAKIYFVKGEALMYSGNIDGAKAAFTNAAYGSYKALAEHYLQTL
ncbi:MAG: tetratricopeptide repeat protein [Rhodothermales bacterium]